MEYIYSSQENCYFILDDQGNFLCSCDEYELWQVLTDREVNDSEPVYKV